MGLTVDGEHHQTQFSFTVIRYGLFNGGAVTGAEILVRHAVVFFAIIIKWVAATHLGKGMDVNGNKVFVVHSESVAFLMAPEVSAKPTRQRLTEKILRR